MRPTSAQIGRAGELLVQLRLIQNGIDSSPMTTDAGIDLVTFSPQSGRATTIQVKTNERPKPGGGKGKPALDWRIPDQSPADQIALVDLQTSRVWLFSMADIKHFAQQHASGNYHFYMYTDPSVRTRRPQTRSFDAQFTDFLVENQLPKLL